MTDLLLHQLQHHQGRDMQTVKTRIPVEGYSPSHIRMMEDGEDFPSPPGSYSTARPPRVVILAEAQSLTWGERDKEYGDPAVNFEASYEGKTWLRKWAARGVRTISPQEMEALENAIQKIARIITGTPKPDSYVDLCGYGACAGEMAERATEAEK